MNRSLWRWGNILSLVVLLAGTSVQGGPPPALTPFAKGILEKVDLANRQLVVQIDGSTHTFHWTDRTYVFRGKEKITPAQLKTNDVVALRVDRGPGGQLMIRRMKTYPAAR